MKISLILHRNTKNLITKALVEIGRVEMNNMGTVKIMDQIVRYLDTRIDSSKTGES